MDRFTFTLTTRFVTDTERGFISLDVEADRPLREYVAHPHLRCLDEGYCASVAGAREVLDTAARTIRFMDGAWVRPSKAWVSLFMPHEMRCGVGPTGFDHTQVWNWAGRLRLVTTEPYERGVSDALDWCFDHGWDARQLPAWGMWNPPATTLILCAPPRRGADLDSLLGQLQKRQPIAFDDRQTAGTVTRKPRGRGAA